MATAVNSQNSFEFVKTDDTPADQEMKDDAIASHDSIQTVKHGEYQYLKEEIDLPWEHNGSDTKGAVGNVTTGTIDTIPLEDIPIIILQHPSQKANSTTRKKKIYECRICRSIFQDPLSLREHALLCKIIGCPLCNFRTFDESLFKDHWQQHEAQLKKAAPVVAAAEVQENTEMNFECPNCKKKYKTKNQLYLHMFKCDRLQCMHCDYETFKSYELKRHFQNNHLKPEEISRTCPRCKKILKNAHSLSTHLWICGKKPRCECHHCGYKTFNKWNLRTHILARHVQPKIEKNLSHGLFPSENVSVSPISQTADDDNMLTSKECTLCHKIFKHQRALHAHSLHCKLYKCNHCPFESFIKAYLKKHININHKLKIDSTEIQHDIPSSSSCTEQMCRICYEIFQNERSLRAHATHCREYECTSCKYKTYIKADLENHITLKHEQNERLVKNGVDCPKCGKSYKNKHVVNNHVIYCGKDFLRCEYCFYKTKRPGVLKKHMKSVHPSELEAEENVDPPIEEDEELTTACAECGQKLKNHETMTFHSFYCPRKPFLDCNMCSFKTRYGLCLKNHILRVHCQSNKPSYECPKCSGQLKTQETFKKHLFSCIPESVLRCSVCTYMTRDPSCLSDHVLDKHYKDNPSDTSDIKLIPCPKCGRKLKDPQSLRSHLMNCEKESHLECAQCPFKANTKAILDRHVLMKHKTKH